MRATKDHKQHNNSPTSGGSGGILSRAEKTCRTQAEVDELLCGIYCVLKICCSCPVVFLSFCPFTFFLCRPSVTRIPDRPHWDRIWQEEGEAIRQWKMIRKETLGQMLGMVSKSPVC